MCGFDAEKQKIVQVYTALCLCKSQNTNQLHLVQLKKDCQIRNQECNIMTPGALSGSAAINASLYKYITRTDTMESWMTCCSGFCAFAQKPPKPSKGTIFSRCNTIRMKPRRINQMYVSTPYMGLGLYHPKKPLNHWHVEWLLSKRGGAFKTLL